MSSGISASQSIMGAPFGVLISLRAMSCLATSQFESVILMPDDVVILKRSKLQFHALPMSVPVPDSVGLA